MRAAFAGGLVLLAALAGCGGDGGPSVERSSEATAQTRAAGSSRVELEVAIESGGASLRIIGAGVADFRKEASSIAIAVPAAPEAGELKLITDGPVAYIGLPPGTRAAAILPRGKRWLRLDRRAAPAADVDLSQFEQVRAYEPGDQLFLLDSGGRLERIARQDVRGVETTRYRTRVDLKQAYERSLRELPAAARRTQRTSVREFVRSLDKRIIRADLWLDDRGRIRRLATRITVNIPQPNGTTVPVSTRLSMELYEFGVRAAVERPPASDVVDATALGE